MKHALPTALLVLAAAALASRADDAGDLETVFSKVDAKAETVKDVKAEFTQTKQMKILKRPQLSGGHLSVKKTDGGPRICWESWDVDPDTSEKSLPQRLLILGDTKEMVNWSLEEKTGERTDLGKGKVEVSEFLTIGGSLSGLKNGFTVELAGRPAEGKGWELKLTPTSERLKKFIRELRLEIDPVEWVIVRIFVRDTGDNTTDIRLTSFQVNKGVDEKLYEVPKDVKLTDVSFDK